MKTKELIYLFQNPSQLKKEQTDTLEKLIKEFPYFQSARSLRLKGLKDQESFRYNQELKTTAAYTIDRSILFDFITSTSFNKTVKASIETKHVTDIDVLDAEEIKVLPKRSIDETAFTEMAEQENRLNSTLSSSKKEHTHKKNKEQDKPFDFCKKEKHSFREWLQLSSMIQPINRKIEYSNEGKQDEKLSKQKLRFDMIDEFITNNPKIKPVNKSTSPRNLANDHLVSKDELMTETLARVYLAQHKYKNAIQAYKILILKNPEKSGYFADQIRAIKKLQENK